MTDQIFVLIYISNPAASRYLKCESALRFLGLIREKGAQSAVYAGGLGSVGPGPAEGPQSASVEEIGLCLNRCLRRYKTVFFVSDSQMAVSSAAGKAGCIPFLLKEGGQLGFACNEFIEIEGLSSLEPYFEGSQPYHLFTILRGRPEDYQEQICKHNADIAEQVRARSGVHVFGTGTNGELIWRECRKVGLQVLGFIDNDVRKQGQVFYGLPVKAPSELDPAHDVVILASGNCSYDIYMQLRNMGFKYVQNLAEFFFAFDSVSQPGISFRDKSFQADLWRNRIFYHALFLRVADSMSRKVLEGIVGFRKSFDLSLTGGICDRQNPQWFDGNYFKPDASHVFVDAGAFDGDTALNFIRCNGSSYKAIHLFEADPKISKRAAVNLGGDGRIYVHNMGLSDKEGTFFFSQTGQTNGRLTEGDGIPVRVSTVDAIVKDKITFIKMDIEGVEKEAIYGASHHIRDDSPLLAVAVYHKAQDIWAVPRLVLEINPDYEFYLRHYTQFAYETVMYAVCKAPKDAAKGFTQDR